MPRVAALIAFGLTVSLTALGSASIARAGEHHPTGSFAQFSDCPLSNALTWKCFVNELSSGVLVLGKRTIPVNTTITIRGAMTEPSKREETILAAEDGNTLSKATLPVPGGLLGIISPAGLPESLRVALDGNVDKGLTAVTATVESADPSSPGTMSEFYLLAEEETALRLALKIKLSNPFLGSDCYIGTSADPIVFSMTSGTTSPPSPNKPITGASGTSHLLDNAEIAILSGGRFVDNAFSAPVATGCGGASSALVDTAIDAQLGLPSPAGYNTVVLGNTLVVATIWSVLRSE
jgi:hypothetical protein